MKYGVWAVRGAASIFGRAEAWCKENGKPLAFDTEEQANEYANGLNRNVGTAHVRYYVREMVQEFSDIALGMEG